MNIRKFLAITLLAVACHSQKKVAETKKEESRESTQTKPKKANFAIAQSEWSSFEAKTHIDYENTSNPLPINDFNAKLRMQKDKFVWISVAMPLIGGEAVRALITADSVKIVDHINRKYLTTTFTYIQKFSSVPLTLSKLQAALLGNPTFDLNGMHTDTSEGFILAVFQDAKVRNVLMAAMDDSRIRTNKLMDLLKNQDFTAEYAEFLTVGGVKLPGNVFFKTTNPQAASANLTYENIQLNKPINGEFKIPSSYKRMGQ